MVGTLRALSVAQGVRTLEVGQKRYSLAVLSASVTILCSDMSYMFLLFEIANGTKITA